MADARGKCACLRMGCDFCFGRCDKKEEEEEEANALM